MLFRALPSWFLNIFKNGSTTSSQDSCSVLFCSEAELLELPLLHPMHYPSFPFTTILLENLHTTITPPTWLGWVTMLRPSLPSAWEALLSWAPHTPAPVPSHPQSSAWFIWFWHLAWLALPCSYLWPPVGFKLPHKLGPALVHPLPEMATDQLVFLIHRLVRPSSNNTHFPS